MPRLDRPTYQKIYALLDRATPLPGDCGELCGRLCCRPRDPDLGIYLFPGEETMFTRREPWLTWTEQEAQDYDFPPTWRGTVYFVRCTGSCPRENRPLQCRFFPLTAHYLPDGSLALIWETLFLPYRCPLLSRQFPLQNDFVVAAARAWELLIEDPRVRDLVLWDSRQREKALGHTAFLRRPRRPQASPLQIVKVIRFA